MGENEDVISSISKGCFFFKPKSQVHEQKSPKRKRKLASKGDSLDYLESFPNENGAERTKRFDTFTSCWGDLHTQIKEVQDALNETIFNDLLKYVQEIHINENKSSYTSTEIPTAALVTGVNVPDHKVFFSKFVSILKEHVSPLVAQLHSKDCTNLKLLIKNAFDGLADTADVDFDDMSEDSFLSDEEGDNVTLAKRFRKPSVFKKYTFTELKKWYDDNCLHNISDISGDENESTKDKANPPIVLIFEDFDRFSSVVLQDFILICSEYIVDVPIVLLFGVTTAVNTVHKLLPHFVSSKLSIQKFQSLPSLVCLTQVIDKVIITDRNAFKLGPQVFRLLYEHFLYHDFSINNFVRGLKFCVLEHFYSQPMSVMCTKNVDDINEYINGCSGRKMDNIKKIPSFKRFIEKKSETDQKRLEADEKLMKTYAVNHMKRLQACEELFYPMVKLLHKCTCKLPTYPLGKWQRDVYEYCTISSNITKEKRFETAMKLLRMLSRDEFLAILVDFVVILDDVYSKTRKLNPLKEEARKVRDFIEKFSYLNKIFDEEEDAEVEIKKDEKKEANRKSMPVYKSRYEFQEKMKLAVKETEKKKETPYEKLRTSIIDFLELMFKKHLHSPLSMTGHEIFYYDDVQTVRQRLNGTPRIAIQKALSSPRCYLNCLCCSKDSDEIHGSLPDISILYKLHLESGRLINLYDWLQAFVSFIDPTLADDKKKKTQKKKKQEEQLQARFIRGISELQFLGFIKGTRAKTDHVSRLTWGGC